MPRNIASTRRALFLARSRGDEAAALRHEAALVKAETSREIAPRTKAAGLPAFYDAHKGAVHATAFGVGLVGGQRANAAFGPVSPLELQPSTVGAGMAGVVALAAHAFGYRRTRNIALTTGLGALGATVAAHVPVGGMLKKES